MANESIQPEKVTRPYQLLAAAFVALIVIDSAFLTAAGLLTKPDWLPAMLAIAAVANVPVFLISTIVLQTRYRAEMQDDSFYSDYLKRKGEADAVAKSLQAVLADAGVDPQAIALGVSGLDTTLPHQARKLIKELDVAVDRVRVEAEKVGAQASDAYAAYELASAYMAAGEWQKAATQYNEYLRTSPTDWEAHFARGVALVNSRQGVTADLAALRAYNEAIALAGDSVDRNMRAKMLTYRGAVLKRLGRLDEAESDLLLGRNFASAPDIIADNTYNLAGVYALRGDRTKLLAAIRELQHSPDYLDAVHAHRNDYFRAFVNDPEFVSLVKTPGA